MNINTAAILRGPATVSWRGTKFYHRGNLSLPIAREAIDIDVEPFGIAFRAHDKTSFPINFTPSGRVEEVANIVNRYSTTVAGELVNIEEYPVTINATNDILTTATAHLLATGDEVMLHWLVTQPAPLSRTTRYYARVLSPTTLTLHPSAANAGAGTNTIDITTAGSGVVLDVTRKLVIHTMKGLKITFYNAGLVQVPDLRFTAAQTLLGELGFMAFVRNGHDPADPDGAYYTIEYEAWNDTSFDPADIKVQSPTVVWDIGAPWDAGLSTRAGATVAFDLQTSPLESDAWGDDSLALIFQRIDATATAAVQGVTEAEVLAATKAHSAVRGQDIAGDGSLQLDTPAYSFALADAALINAPQQFSSTEQRMGDLVWRANQTFTAGVKNPLYELTEN